MPCPKPNEESIKTSDCLDCLQYRSYLRRAVLVLSSPQKSDRPKPLKGVLNLLTYSE